MCKRALWIWKCLGIGKSCETYHAPYLDVTWWNAKKTRINAPYETLAWAIKDYLDVQGHLTERIFVNQTGVELAGKLEDRSKGGNCSGNLGNTYIALGDVEKAVNHDQ